VIAISPSASRRRVAASWLRAVSGIPSGSSPPFAARSAPPLIYLAARRSNAGGNKISAGWPAGPGAGNSAVLSSLSPLAVLLLLLSLDCLGGPVDCGARRVNP